MAAIHRLPTDGPLLRTGADALGLIYDPGSEAAEWIAVPAARLDPSFYDLRSGVAGEFVQKFVNYGRRLAIVGDISVELAQSGALRDFVSESNRGRQVWFVADDDELSRRTARAGDDGHPARGGS